jgi:glycosyltransferase involved in cell wall biosynthesis
MLVRKKVKIVLPVYNEEKELEDNTLKLYEFAKNNLLDYDFEIQIADNASTDTTSEIGQRLAQQFKEISFLRLNEKGRGRAVKKAWGEGNADIFVYMDIDLSTDLKHLPNLIGAIDNFDIAIGSRLLPTAKVIGRTLKREIISRSYNLLIKIIFGIHFSDAQCGFKAISRKAIKELLPNILDNEWFFDTELLVVGEKIGYKIYQEPVAWVDNPGSTVRVLKTAAGDLKGLFRLFLSKPWRNSAN